MPRRAQVLAVALIVVTLGIAAVFFTRDGSEDRLSRISKIPFVSRIGFADEGVAIACEGSVVELEFEPKGPIEARADGKTVAVANVVNGELNYDICNGARRPHAFNQGGLRYTRLKERTTLTCRIPGRFVLTVSPVSPSWAGERAAGNAIAVVLERRLTRNPGPQRTILASATVLERSHESGVVFLRDYCAPSSN